MKQSISPTTAGVIIGVVVLLAIGMIWMRSSQGPGAPSKEGRNEMGMPEDVAKEMKSRLEGKGGITGPPKQGPPPGVPGGPPR